MLMMEPPFQLEPRFWMSQMSWSPDVQKHYQAREEFSSSLGFTHNGLLGFRRSRLETMFPLG